MIPFNISSLYRGWEVTTTGNPYAHAILRGYVDKFGRNIPNYHYEDLQNLLPSKTRICDGFSIAMFANFLGTILNITLDHKSFYQIMKNTVLLICSS